MARFSSSDHLSEVSWNTNPPLYLNRYARDPNLRPSRTDFHPSRQFVLRVPQPRLATPEQTSYRLQQTLARYLASVILHTISGSTTLAVCWVGSSRGIINHTVYADRKIVTLLTVAARKGARPGSLMPSNNSVPLNVRNRRHGYR